MSPHGIVVNLLDCDILVTKFKFSESMNLLYPSFGLDSVTAFLLLG